MRVNISNEILIMIFKHLLSDVCISGIRNVRLVSKEFNNLMIVCVQDFYKTKVNVKREADVWRDLVNSFLVSCFAIDVELELRYPRMFSNNAYFTIAKYLLRHVGLKNAFIRRYRFLRDGRRMYRKSLAKNFVMSNRDLAKGEFKRKNFYIFTRDIWARTIGTDVSASWGQMRMRSILKGCADIWI